MFSVRNLVIIFSAMSSISICAVSQAQDDFWMSMYGPYYGDIPFIDFNSQGDIYAGTYRTTDGGENWEDFRKVYSEYFNDLTINSQDHIFIFVDSHFEPGTGVFRSTDYGETWERILSKTANCDIEINANGYIFVGANGEGLYRSIDNGDSWELLPLPGTVAAISFNSQGMILAARGWTLFSSDDDGITWTERGSIHGTISSIAFNSMDEAYAGVIGSNEGLYRSTNNGDDWITIWEEDYVNKIEVDQEDYLYVATENSGVLRSIDGGLNWDHLGLQDFRVRTIEIQNDSILWAGTYQNGIFMRGFWENRWHHVGTINPSIYSIGKSTINDYYVATNVDIYRYIYGDSSWVSCNIAPFLYSELVIDEQDNIFVARRNGGNNGIYWSTDYGESWDQLLSQNYISSLVLRDESELWVGVRNNPWGGKIWRSTDKGQTWTSYLDNYGVNSIEISRDGIIFAGQDDGILRSTDNGLTWMRILEQGAVIAIICNDNGDIIAADDGQIIRSSDNGDTWIYEDSLNSTINSFAIDSEGHLYAAASNSGVYISLDDGSRWSKLRSDLSYNFAYSLYVDSDDFVYSGHLYTWPRSDKLLLQSKGVASDLIRVWPGDLDNNGIVEAADIIPLIVHWNENCEPRQETDFGWYAHVDLLWEDIPDSWYADANGDGIVEIQDFLAICINWQLTHDTYSPRINYDNLDLSLYKERAHLIYKQVKNSTDGAEYEIKLYLEDFLDIMRPTDFLLYSPYPNPFNSSITINYDIPNESAVELSVFNILGREVRNLGAGEKSPGEYSIIWDGLDNSGKPISSGLYFIRLKADNYEKYKKTILLK